MTTRRRAAPGTPADPAAGLRAAVDGFLGAYYPGCRRAALVFDPGPPLLPDLVVVLRDDVPAAVDIDAASGPGGRYIPLLLKLDELADAVAVGGKGVARD